MININLGSSLGSHMLKKILLLVSLTVINHSAFAEAGRVLFTSGVVTAEGIDGEVRRIFKRSLVDSGETIKT